MKILFIGGTGLISSASSELAVKRGIDLTILNRGISNKYPLPKGARLVIGDIFAETADGIQKLNGQRFDAVVDWIAYNPNDIERDIHMFNGKTDQFIFISSASAYQKPPAHYFITEDTPLENPYWDYSRNKISCEQRLMQEYHSSGFPVTIVRPSLTYGPSQIPLCVGSWLHPYTVLERMRKNQRVIIPGDGTSLWVTTWNEDFAKGLIGLLGKKEAIGEAFNITSDEVRTWNYLYEEVARSLGVELHPIHIASDLLSDYDPHLSGSLIGDKVNSVVFDNTKIKNLVPDFECTVPWAEGVRHSIAWFDADPTRRTIDNQANQTWDRIIQDYSRIKSGQG